MDMNKVKIKYKKNAKGTHFIAYCEEYSEIQGIGISEENATANFWRAYNNAESKNDLYNAQLRKAEKVNMDLNNQNEMRMKRHKHNQHNEHHDIHHHNEYQQTHHHGKLHDLHSPKAHQHNHQSQKHVPKNSNKRRKAA